MADQNFKSELNRIRYLNEQKARGRYLLGVFPALYPREILWAFNILPVEIWDPPGTAVLANKHLQPYICPIVRNGLELILRGDTDIVDGFLFSHTCDSLQNLASIVNDHLEINKPVFSFYHPKMPYTAATQKFYQAQLEVLTDQLTSNFGPMDTDRLTECLRLSHEICRQLNKIFELQRTNQLNFSNSEYYTILRQGEFLWPEDYLKLLNEITAGETTPSKPGTAIVLSGILPNPVEILSLLDKHNVKVAADDLLNNQRRFYLPQSKFSNPMAALTSAYLQRPPCSTIGSPISERLNHLLNLANGSNAKGIVFLIPKFCEPELFDLPQLKQGLQKAEISALVIETELNCGLTGQLTTRLEAFIEMLGN